MPAQSSSRTLLVRQSITLLCLATRCDLLYSHHTSLAQFISTGTSFLPVFHRRTSVSFLPTLLAASSTASTICGIIDGVQTAQPFTSHYICTDLHVLKTLPNGMPLPPSQKGILEVIQARKTPHAGPSR